MRPITTASDCADFARLYGRTPAAVALEALVIALTNATMQAIERDRFAENVDPTDAIEAEKTLHIAEHNWSMMMCGQSLGIGGAVTEWRLLLEQDEIDRLMDMDDGGENRWTQPVGGFV
jgi:hypothetical protein